MVKHGEEIPLYSCLILNTEMVNNFQHVPTLVVVVVVCV